MVWCDDADLDVVAEMGACICHNAGSNLRPGSGIAPCAVFLRRGIATALGIDEGGINDDRDMLQEMRLAPVLHRARGIDESAVTAADVFRMATESGGRTTPFGARIGRLDPEAFADLVLYDRAVLFRPLSRQLRGNCRRAHSAREAGRRAGRDDCRLHGLEKGGFFASITTPPTRRPPQRSPIRQARRRPGGARSPERLCLM
jgi:cytosine/adenosine deaminase-related metal-dependent hydrolase